MQNLNECKKLQENECKKLKEFKRVFIEHFDDNTVKFSYATEDRLFSFSFNKVKFFLNFVLDT